MSKFTKKIPGYKVAHKIKKSATNLMIDANIKDQFSLDCFAADTSMSAVITQMMVSYSVQSALIRKEAREAYLAKIKEMK